MLGTPVSKLHDPTKANEEEVPDVIRQLYGTKLIFRFDPQNHNLKQQKGRYLVKRTFVPDENLEKNFMKDKAAKVSILFTHFKY